MRKWDDSLKTLVTSNPQYLVSLLFPGAQFLELLNIEMTNRKIYADLLLKIRWQEEEIIVHVEFQRHADKDMPKRVWEYNALSTYLYQLPTISFVVYLIEEANIPEPVYIVKVNGKTIHVFFYDNVKLWEMEGDVLKQDGLEGLLPLLPLTKNGTQHKAIEEMITLLQTAGKQDLLPFGYSFAALLLKDVTEKDWLQRRFYLMQDILEESWAFQEMVNLGFSKGYGKGYDKGYDKGRGEGYGKGYDEGLDALRKVFMRFVQKRFPEQVELAQQVSTQISDMKILQTLSDNLLDAESGEEAQRVLMRALQVMNKMDKREE